MLAPSSDLLRAGIGLKVNQIKRATQSYFRDRTRHATDTAVSYAMAAGLFAAAGIFLIAACLVGAIALYRWIALHHGQFPAFGAVGALLVVIAVLLAGVAAAKLKRPPPKFPSLTSRLRVAIRANPIRSGQTADLRHETVAELAAKAPPRQHALPLGPRPPQIDSNAKIGLAVAGVLLGWVAARRRQQAQQMRP